MRRPRSFLLAALLASGEPSARAETITAQAMEVPAAPSPRGGPVELAIFGGAGGPVGPAGVSVAFLPFSRLALGSRWGASASRTRLTTVAVKGIALFEWRRSFAATSSIGPPGGWGSG